MPDAAVLAEMYGPAYRNQPGAEEAVADPKDPRRVLALLRQRKPGTFVDYGCGSGDLLVEARAAGWTVCGVEFASEVVGEVAGRTGCTVVGDVESLRRARAAPADVVHLGDVIEHLTDPARIVSELAELIRRDGLLIAQGPLEAGPCLFSRVIQEARRHRLSTVREMAPYHVLQATVLGQNLFFQRCGLRTIEYRVSEVAWPAPDRWVTSMLARPRAMALYALRKLSQVASRLNSSRWGNRYFFVGTTSSAT